MQIKINHSLSQGVSKCSLVFPALYGDYGDEVEVLLGAIPGNGPACRFRGVRRNPHFELYPRGVSIDCFGWMQIAAEYLNWRDPIYNNNAAEPQGAGGLLVQYIVPNSGRIGGGATAGEIILSVFREAGVPERHLDAGKIGDSGRIYGVNTDGSLNNLTFLWKAGTLTAEEIQRFAYRKPGESALNYAHRYDQIDAEFDAGQTSGGFYRTFESLGGDIYRVRVGSRPRSNPDVDPTGGPMIFEEGKNILSAQVERQYPTANRVLVQGADSGLGYQIHFEAAGSNHYMNDGYFYDPNAPSSDWIQWNTAAEAALWGFGMDAETVAQARLLEVNRITVVGSLTTAEDWLIGPAQTHMVQGPSGMGDPPGPPVVLARATLTPLWPRLRTGEKVFVSANDIDLTIGGNGAPVFSQTPQFMGGGIEDADLVAPPA